MESSTATTAPRKNYDSIAPSVVIGVGGTGKEVLARVRGFLIEEFGALANIPVVQFLLIDTDPAPPDWKPVGTLEDATRFDESEMVRAAVKWTDFGGNLQQHRHLRDWVDPNLAQYDLTQGAKQNRQLGRLAFFINYARLIRAGFEEAQRKARDAESAKKAEGSRQGLLIDGKRFGVYVVASLSGGTGSGMTIDTAFMVRRLLRSIPGAASFGYLLLPGVFKEHGSRILANAFAALKEIDYFSWKSKEHRLDVQYAEESQHRAVLEGPPFDNLYLVDSSNTEGAILARKADAFDMIARHIFIDFLPSGIGAKCRSDRDNLSSTCDEPDRRGCGQKYMTFGLGRVYFPTERITAGCAAKLALRLVDRWLIGAGGTGGSVGKVGEMVTLFCETTNPEWALGDIRTGMLGRLCTHEDGTSISESIDRDCAELRDNWNSECSDPHKLREYLREWANSKSASYNSDSPSDQEWTQHCRDVARNVGPRTEEYLRKLESEVNRKVDLLLADGGAVVGLDYTRQFLDRLAERVAGYRTTCLDWRAREKERRADQENKIALLLSEVEEKSNSFFRKMVGQYQQTLARLVGEFADLVQEYLRSLLLEAALQKGAELAQRLGDEIQRVRIEVEQIHTMAIAVKEQLLEKQKNLDEGPAGMGELFRAGDVAFFYAQHVTADKESDHVRTLHINLCKVFGVGGLYGLAKVARDPAKAELVAAALVANGAQSFDGVRRISAAQRLLQLYPEEVERKNVLAASYKRSAPYLQFVGVPGYEDSPKKNTLAVGLWGSQSRDEKFTSETERLLADIKNIGVKEGHIRDVSEREKHEIVFVRERAAFPLRAVQQLGSLGDYKRAYDDERSKAYSQPLHIVADAARFDFLPGIDPVEDAIRQRVLRALLLGVKWGVIPDQKGVLYHDVYRGGLGVADRTVVLGRLAEPERAAMVLAREENQEVLEAVEKSIKEIAARCREDPDEMLARSKSVEEYAVTLRAEAEREVQRRHGELPPERANDELRKLPQWEISELLLGFLRDEGLGTQRAKEQGAGKAKPSRAATAAAPSGSPARPASASPTPAGAGCPMCGEPTAQAGMFCPKCGERVPEVSSRCSACNRCGKPLDPGAQFCPGCGSPVAAEPLACPKCRKEAAPDHEFCMGCGAKLR